MDLNEKLKFLGTSEKPKKMQKGVPDRPDIGQWVQGKEVENEYGCFFLVEHSFSVAHQHGIQSLQFQSDIPTSTYALAGKDERLHSFNPKKTLYLDTETTGLAGGAGTAPFMIGVGFFTEDAFTIEQYFMRDYHEECAMLNAFLSRLNEFNSLATYNGKCYDVNLIVSRFILHRIKNTMQQIPHLDLLFTMRRLYKRRLSDCSLGNIENYILGFIRQDDVPGYLIPSHYFEYLRTGQGERLTGIFEHNRWDILSLAALTNHVGQVYHHPMSILKYEKDWLSLGRAFESFSLIDIAIYCYKNALKLSSVKDMKNEVRFWLSGTYKRMGRWHEAVFQWEKMIESGSSQIFPFEELAKYYEHQTKDYSQAIHWVNRALERLDILMQLKHEIQYENEHNALTYRLNRLKRKVGKD